MALLSVNRLFYRRSGPILIVGLLVLMVGLLAIPSGSETLLRYILTAAAIFIISTAVLMEMMAYLQQSRRATPNLDRSRTLDVLANDLKNLKRDVNEVKSQFDANQLSNEDREEIKDRIFKSLEADAVVRLTEDFEARFREGLELERLYDGQTQLWHSMRSRLTDEIFALGKRANINLGLGVIISSIGIGLLGYFVVVSAIELGQAVPAVDVGIRFAIRFSIVIVIQLFAFFFLRLYRYGLFEIKYFQNEMTNAEFKMVSLVVAIERNDKVTISKICLDLSKSERNFILKKGETTVGLRRDELELAYEESLMSKGERVAGRRFVRS